MNLRPHMQWLAEVGGYMGEVTSLLVNHLEKIPMSAESDAAKQQLAALKADLDTLASELQGAIVTHTATSDDASANKQALEDLQAEAAALRAQVASIRTILQPAPVAVPVPAAPVTTTVTDPATGTITTTAAAANGA